MDVFRLIDTVKLGGKNPRGLILLFDPMKAKENKVAVFGTSEIAYLTGLYLKYEGYDVCAFINNSDKHTGKKFCGQVIIKPSEAIENNYYIIVAASEPKFYNENFWQLKFNGYLNYGCALIENIHDFSGDNDGLQSIVEEEISKLLFGSKKLHEVVSPTYNVGPGSNSSFIKVKELCWSTTWSHHLLSWYNENCCNVSEKPKELLEIGPGLGYFSSVLHRIDPTTDIYWLLFDLENETTLPKKNKIDTYPGCMFKTYSGVLENPKFTIEKTFDVIIMTEVMEHFSTNPIKTVKRIKSMMKPGGELYLSTPNWGHVMIYDTYEDMPDFSDLQDYCGRYVGHTYQYSKDELLRIFSECGLKVEKYALSDSNGHNILLRNI